MIAAVYLVSWHSGAVRALLMAVAAVALLASGLAMFAGLSALCVACTPAIAGCCSAAVAALPNACIAAGIIGGAVMLFKWGG